MERKHCFLGIFSIIIIIIIIIIMSMSMSIMSGFYVLIGFIFYFIVFFLMLTSVPCFLGASSELCKWR